MIYLIYIVIYLIQQVSDLSDLSDEFYSRCRERAFNPFETWAANKNVWKQKDDYSIRHPKQCRQSRQCRRRNAAQGVSWTVVPGTSTCMLAGSIDRARSILGRYKSANYGIYIRGRCMVMGTIFVLLHFVVTGWDYIQSQIWCVVI